MPGRVKVSILSAATVKERESIAMSENFGSVVGIYDTMSRAEKAVQRLDQAGLSIKQVSIIARNLESEKRITGFVTTGDVVKATASIGAWTGGVFGLLVGAAFLWVPGFGQLIVAGPLAAALLGSLEGAAAVGATASVLGALIGWGVSKRHILKYEQSVGAGKFLVVYHGSASEVRQANDVLKETEPSSLQTHSQSDVYEC
jgi:uncharacterized membrane protein